MTRMKKSDEEKYAEFPDDTSPVEMEEGVKDINDDNNELYDEGKEAECLDDNSLDKMEEGENDRNDNKNKKYDEEKEADETTHSDSTTIDEVKGVIDGRVGKDVDLDEFDASTCSGGSFYDISDKVE